MLRTDFHCSTILLLKESLISFISLFILRRGLCRYRHFLLCFNYKLICKTFFMILCSSWFPVESVVNHSSKLCISGDTGPVKIVFIIVIRFLPIISRTDHILKSSRCHISLWLREYNLIQQLNLPEALQHPNYIHLSLQLLCGPLDYHTLRPLQEPPPALEYTSI